METSDPNRIMWKDAVAQTRAFSARENDGNILLDPSEACVTRFERHRRRRRRRLSFLHNNNHSPFDPWKAKVASH
jgi:hypothetical protein